MPDLTQPSPEILVGSHHSMDAGCSLLVPVFNAVKWLERLRYQVDQLCPSFDEVLLADDGSTDDTAEIAATMGFKVLRLHRNQGPGAARNALARLSRCEWVHFHDVDDEIAPNYLERMRPAMTPSVDAVFHFVDFVNEVSRELEIRWQFDAEIQRDAATVLLRAPMVTMSSVIRRSKFIEIGGFDETHRCYEDGDMHFRLALAGAAVTGIQEVLEISLRHAGGVSADQRYCHECRLSFLKHYEQLVPDRLQGVLALEAERTAVQFLRMNDRKRANEAIQIARRLGVRVPQTASPILKAMAMAVPPATALALQDGWRRRRAGVRA